MKIIQRHFQNIKQGQAEISTKTVNPYFSDLEESLLNVHSKVIIYCDEINFSDDPGKNDKSLKAERNIVKEL